MTNEEAVTVAKIIIHADHECPVCVGNLVTDLQAAFPDFDWKALAEKEAEDETYGRN